jgi:hypothetical protein
LRFSLTHDGRGGTVLCEPPGGDPIRLAIEHVGGGHFCVHLRGAVARRSDGTERALQRANRDELRLHLRTWLDETGRPAWTIDG